MTDSLLPADLAAFVDASDDAQALEYLKTHRQTLMTNEAVVAFVPMLEAEANPERRDRMQARQTILHAAMAFHQKFQQTLQDLGDSFLTWVQTPDWDFSKAYLQDHADTLLTEQGELALRYLCEAHPDSATFSEHLLLFQRCRKVGIVAAYDELRRSRVEHGDTLPQRLRAVFAFVQAASETEARALLAAEPDVLLAQDVEQMLEGLIVTAQQEDDDSMRTLVQARLAMWRAVRHG
jgi:hypothetical protein